MNTRLLIPCAIAVLTATVHAADWEAMKRSPASIEVINMQPTPLVVSAEKGGWAKIPDQLSKYNAVIYKPTGNTNGVTDLTVLSDGWLIVSCNYDYQGNNGGNWDEEVWSEKKFRTKGWHLLSKNEVGGLLVKTDNKEQTLFCKQVRKGEKLRMRCNKYDPPFPILLSSK
jgi:hypothetical protein